MQLQNLKISNDKTINESTSQLLKREQLEEHKSHKHAHRRLIKGRASGRKSTKKTSSVQLSQKRIATEEKEEINEIEQITRRAEKKASYMLKQQAENSKNK